MKSKKKLLIAMAAMSVAAIGAGTVSTFAWYTASAATKLSTVATDGYGVTTKGGELSLSGLTIYLDITASTPVELTNSSGQVSGVLSDGSVATPISNDGHDVQAEYTGTVSFTTQPSADQLVSLRNKSFTFVNAVSATGNVVISASGTYNSSNKASDVTVAFNDVEITVEAKDANNRYPLSAGKATVTFASAYYMVRTNNPYGKECFTAAEYADPKFASVKGLGQEVTATADPGGTPAAGTAYVDTTNEQFKVRNTSSGWDTTEWHSKDIIKVVAVNNVSGV